MNSALNCTWKPILHSSLHDLYDIGFHVRRSDRLQVFNSRIRQIDLNNLINKHCTCMLWSSWHFYSDMFFYSLKYCSFNQYMLR